jgi:glucose/arabinose dehydrogenase
VLSPSATIAVGYSTTVVRTKAGRVVDGVINDIDDRGMTLVGGDGQAVHLTTGEIRDKRTLDVSLMPEGLQAGLTQQEFADLIDYLASLKIPESTAANEHGMPAVIPELAKPAELRPFLRPENRFEHPVWFGPVPGNPHTYTVVEHETGRIMLLDKSHGGESKSVFLETGRFQPGTRGLLGMVFHPQYASNHRYFIAKHFNENGDFETYIFEGEATSDGRHDSGKPLKTILRFDNHTNGHYGGGLAFGPDGYLYAGMGDAGPQQDPQGHGQNLGLLLGKMLRLDVGHAEPGRAYAIPPDNPFVGRPGVRPEIWAVGFREPWRFSFDPLTNELWVGDVGQDLYEEVDVVRKGENYGWNVYEGFQPFSNKYRRDGEHFTPPVFAYSRKYGASVTGGFVYRADPKSSFYGAYVFADYQHKRLFALTQEGRVLTKVRQVARPSQMPVSIGRDEAGELYVVGYEGMIYHIDLSGATFE